MSRIGRHLATAIAADRHQRQPLGRGRVGQRIERGGRRNRTPGGAARRSGTPAHGHDRGRGTAPPAGGGSARRGPPPAPRPRSRRSPRATRATRPLSRSARSRSATTRRSMTWRRFGTESKRDAMSAQIGANRAADATPGRRHSLTIGYVQPAAGTARRRAARPTTTPKPAIISAQLDSSGTAVGLK